jgi:hypothetical protein
VLLAVQLAGVLLYPFIEDTGYSAIALNLFGLIMLLITLNLVRTTPASAWVSAIIGAMVVALVVLQVEFDMEHLLSWSAGLESAYYFYAAYSLICYMMADNRTTVDEMYAAAGTFTLLVWAFTYLFVMTQALQPGAFSMPGEPAKSWFDLNHLSFALLTGTGMGQVVPVSSHARALASIEMLVGLAYLAGIVSRLIAFTVRDTDSRGKRK